MSIIAGRFLSEMMLACKCNRSNFIPALADSMSMSGTGLLIYDDEQGEFGPLTDLRPAYDLRTGARTTRERIEHFIEQPADVLIPPRQLTPLTDHARVDLSAHDRWRIVSGRCAEIDAVRDAPTFSRDDVQRMIDHNDWPEPNGAALDRPWHVIAHLDNNLRHDLDRFDLPSWDAGRGDSVARLGDHPVRVAPDAKIHPMVVLNSELGPIVIDRSAIVGSFAVIAGPCYIGEGSIVTPHAHIRAHSVVGPRCVIGGEVSFSVMQGFANKCHAGYLGHSFVGEWVNLGADTTVSNLKNTYGNVRVALRSDAGAEDSGLHKLGPVIGDYVRTGIGTRLVTGSCVGTGSMVAVSGFTAKCIDRFRFVTDGGDQPYDIERFLATARRMMSRRERELGSGLEQILRELAASG